MIRSKHTLIDIANVRPASPKAQRQEALVDFSDLLAWNEFANSDVNSKLENSTIESDMISIIQRQFQNVDELQVALARCLVEVVNLKSQVQLDMTFRDEVHKQLHRLETIEKTTSKGGRKPNDELYKMAHEEFCKWVQIKGGKPSARVLSGRVQMRMEKLKNGPLENGNLYLAERTARKFISQMIDPITEEMRQELVKSYLKS
jgi:hypothetical protein